MIKVKGLNKVFNTAEGPVYAVKEMSFEVRQGEFYTLLGPSGCGKSTTLRCVAGLERPDSGEITIDQIVVNSANVYLPPNERPISMVFQSYAIWPHKTVFGNVEFPLKHIKPKPSKAERKERVMNALAQVQMQKMAHRPSPLLSGGQQQRVALARALVVNPKVLLLDEPLSNLDAKLREDLRLEIKDLVTRLGMTALYVTHDQLEALVMSDRISVIMDGQIVQEAPPKELYITPKNKFVAQFIGRINVFEGRVGDKNDQGMAFVENPDGRFFCPIPPAVEKGQAVTVGIRPEFFDVSSERVTKNDVNVIEGKVDRTVFVGDAILCKVLWGKQTLHIQLPATSNIQSGDTIILKLNSQYCSVFPGAGV
jgi:iron(III) transport system ATP-binding protein